MIEQQNAACMKIWLIQANLMLTILLRDRELNMLSDNFLISQLGVKMKHILYLALAIVFLGGNALKADVVVSEFLNNADSEDAGREWIELYNTSGSAVDLTGWTITDEGSNSYTFGSTVIGANDFLIVVNSNGVGANDEDAAAKAIFEAEWLSGVADTRVIGGNIGALSNSSDEIILSNDNSIIQFSLAYANDEDEDSTALTPQDFDTTSYGNEAAPGVVREGDDNGTLGLLGFEDSGDFVSVFEGDFAAIQDANFLTSIGVDVTQYDNVDQASEADPLRLSAVSVSVPEPTSLGLLGLLGVGALVRRKR